MQDWGGGGWGAREGDVKPPAPCVHSSRASRLTARDQVSLLLYLSLTPWSQGPPTDLNKGLGYSSPVFKMMLEKLLWFIRSLGRGEIVGMASEKARTPSIIQRHILTLHPHGPRWEKHKWVRRTNEHRGVEKGLEEEQREMEGIRQRRTCLSIQGNKTWFKSIWRGTSPAGPVIKTALPMQGRQIQSLVRELRSYMPLSMAKRLKIF